MSWLLVPLAFAAMGCQDILSVWLVRAESQGRAHAAARWDVAGDACRMAWLYAGGDALFVSRDVPLAAAVITATLAADYCGTFTGVLLSARLEKRRRVQVDDELSAWFKSAVRKLGGGP